MKLGDVFVNSSVFKEAVREVAISVGRKVWFPCNEKGSVKGICKAKENGCSWSLWASKYERNSDSLMLKSMNDTHSCPRKKKNRCANSNWLSKRYTDQLGSRAGFKISQFMRKVRKDYVLEPLKGQIHREKRKVEQIVEGSLVAQYAKISDYGEELKKCNQGTTIVIEAEVGPKKKELFKRIYICLDACKKYWVASCRPIIGLDASHAKSFHKAQLIFVVGLDAKNSYYTIAYRVIERKGFETWKWFLELLKADLELEDPFAITFMADRQKGLIEAL